jgi:hypothetical protein
MSFFALSSGIKQLTCASRLGSNAQLQTLPEHVSTLASAVAGASRASDSHTRAEPLCRWCRCRPSVRFACVAPSAHSLPQNPLRTRPTCRELSPRKCARPPAARPAHKTDRRETNKGATGCERSDRKQRDSRCGCSMPRALARPHRSQPRQSRPPPSSRSCLRRFLPRAVVRTGQCHVDQYTVAALSQCCCRIMSPLHECASACVHACALVRALCLLCVCVPGDPG